MNLRDLKQEIIKITPEGYRVKTNFSSADFLVEIGNFIISAKTICTDRKGQDSQTIGLLLCKGKDRLSVEWALKGTNNPIGVTSYEVRNELPKEILDRLPTEEDINKFMDMD